MQEPLGRSTTLSDIDLLSQYERLLQLRTAPPPATQQRIETRRAVNRRIVEAMMLQWAFGGPVRSSVTPAVSAAIGLWISRNGYGSLAGAVVGTSVACLGPMFTRWHLRQYADGSPDVTMGCMAETWTALHAGQGDAYNVRLERLKPGLESVPNGIRRRIGKVFVFLQSTASLRSLFTQVYTDCLTGSEPLQAYAQEGKQLLAAETDREAVAQKMELAHLRTRVLEQEETIRSLQIDGSHEGLEVQQAMGRLDEVERALTQTLRQLEPLLKEMREGASMTIVHMQMPRSDESMVDLPS